MPSSSDIKTIYVSDLAEGVQKDELVAVCRTYGKIENIWVAPASPRFAIVEFERAEDAADIVYDLHGELFCGRKLSVVLYKKSITSRYPVTPPKDSRDAKRMKKSKRERRTPMQYRKRRPPISPSESGKSKSLSSEERTKSPLPQVRELRRSPNSSKPSSSRHSSPMAKRSKHLASPGFESRPPPQKRSRSRSRQYRDCSPKAKRYRRPKSPEYTRSSSFGRSRTFQPSPTRRYTTRPPSPPPYRADSRSPDYNQPRRRDPIARSPPRRDYYRERSVVSPIARRHEASPDRGGPSRYQTRPFIRRGRPISPSPGARTRFPPSSRTYNEPYQRDGPSSKGTKSFGSPSNNNRRDAGSDGSRTRNEDSSKKSCMSPIGGNWDVEEAAKILATTICIEEDWDLDEPKKVDDWRRPKPNRTGDDWDRPLDSRMKSISVADCEENWDTIETKPTVKTKKLNDWRQPHPNRDENNWDRPLDSKMKSTAVADCEENWDTIETKPQRRDDDAEDWDTKKQINSKSRCSTDTSTSHHTGDWSRISKPVRNQRGTTPDDGDWDSPTAVTQSRETPGKRNTCSPDRKSSNEGSYVASKSIKSSTSRVEDLEDVSDEDDVDARQSKNEKIPQDVLEEDWGSQPSTIIARKNRGMTPDDGDWDEQDANEKKTTTYVINSPSKNRGNISASRTWENMDYQTERVPRESTKQTHRSPNSMDGVYQSRKDQHYRESKPMKTIRAATPVANKHEDDWSIASSSSKGMASKRRGVTPDGGDWD